LGPTKYGHFSETLIETTDVVAFRFVVTLQGAEIGPAMSMIPGVGLRLQQVTITTADADAVSLACKFYQVSLASCYIYTVSQKKGATLTMAVTLSILDRFAKFFHYCKEQ